jgi:hypothetical protein
MYNAAMFDAPRSHPVSDPSGAVYQRRDCLQIKGLASEKGDLRKNGENGENGHERHDQAA